MMCKHTLRCNPKMDSWGLLALRVVIGIIFIYSGYSKLFGNPLMTVGMFTKMGFPMPAFWAYFVGLAELVGGLMVLLGIYARIAAVWLSITMVVAILAAHLKGPFQGWFLPLSLLGSLLALMGVGSGDFRLVKAECCCPKCRMAAKENGQCCDDKMKKDGACEAGEIKGGCCGGACASGEITKTCACGSGKTSSMCCSKKSEEVKK